jgi:23S rRNA (cytidine1920-2'-O)/16S rRNA (cytidine1409-2'-O)-methyltransferase
LDQLIVERGLAESRSRAQALLIGGRVRVGAGDEARLDRKPGDQVDPATTIEVATPEPYVSRGGHKLAAALDAFRVDPADRVCLDVGASTGGFTDVLLQRGARRVYAVDVGRGQLAESLRRDSRVVSMERTNARELTDGTLPEPVSLASVDVSFISLRLVLGPIASPVLGPEGNREFLLHLRVPSRDERQQRVARPHALVPSLADRLAAIARPDAA